jgi:hypothetical protein
MYEVLASGQTQGKAAFSHEQPVLSVCWNQVCVHRACGNKLTKLRGLGRQQSLLWQHGQDRTRL